MKKIFFLIIMVILLGVVTYGYAIHNNSIYNVTLPNNFDNFEKDMFPVLLKLNPEEKQLLLNYVIRFKKKPIEITVKEAIENERSFEKTDEGTLFFSRLKEENLKQSIREEINESVFVTFVDFRLENNSINVIFSLKNKSKENINFISGDSSFVIDSDRFFTRLEFNENVPANQTIQVIRKFNFSEFPALKDLKHNSNFKMIVKKIKFQSGRLVSN